MTRLLLVCAGGAIGAGARYLLTLWLVRMAGVGFPWGTLTVNVTGCFLLALLMQAGGSGLTNDLRLALATGVLGGFTTYSAFNYDATAYLIRGMWTKSALYVLATVIGAFAAGLAGTLAGRMLRGV